MVSNIITSINTSLDNVLKTFFKSVSFGVAEVIGTGVKKEPVLIDLNGDAKPLTVDDKYAITIYHLLNNITTSKNPKTGYGDSFGEIKNIISGSMIVFSDSKKTKLTTDELFLFLQANWPESLTVTPYNSVKTLINNVILNSRQVWTSQYGSDYKLKLNQHLTQVNYSIESLHKHGCFVNCPEEYCNTN